MKKTNKTRYAILGMLFDKARSGYDIKKFMEESTAHFWQETDASIYPMLKKLEAEGKVKSRELLRGKRGRMLYSITQAGKAEFVSWMDKQVEQNPYRNELLLKLFFGASVAHTTIIKHLTAHQKKIEQGLKEFDYITTYVLSEVPDDNPHKPFWQMALRYGVLYNQAEAQWINECIQKLKQTKIDKE